MKGDFEYEKKRKSKKLIPIIIVIILLLLSAGGALGFFLLQEKPEDDFNVGYTSNVHADMSASYQVDDGQELEIGEISFRPEDNSTEAKSLIVSDIFLASSKSCVRFAYVFSNNGDDPFRVVLKDGTIKINVTVRYVVRCGISIVDCDLSEGFVVQKGETWMVEQFISVHDEDKEARYESSDGNMFTWTLTGN